MRTIFDGLVFPFFVLFGIPRAIAKNTLGRLPTKCRRATTGALGILCIVTSVVAVFLSNRGLSVGDDFINGTVRREFNLPDSILISTRTTDRRMLIQAAYILDSPGIPMPILVLSPQPGTLPTTLELTTSDYTGCASVSAAIAPVSQTEAGSETSIGSAWLSRVGSYSGKLQRTTWKVSARDGMLQCMSMPLPLKVSPDLRSTRFVRVPDAMFPARQGYVDAPLCIDVWSRFPISDVTIVGGTDPQRELVPLTDRTRCLTRSAPVVKTRWRDDRATVFARSALVAYTMLLTAGIALLLDLPARREARTMEDANTAPLDIWSTALTIAALGLALVLKSPTLNVFEAESVSMWPFSLKNTRALTLNVFASNRIQALLAFNPNKPGDIGLEFLGPPSTKVEFFLADEVSACTSPESPSTHIDRVVLHEMYAYGSMRTAWRNTVRIPTSSELQIQCNLIVKPEFLLTDESRVELHTMEDSVVERKLKRQNLLIVTDPGVNVYASGPQVEQRSGHVIVGDLVRTDGGGQMVWTNSWDRLRGVYFQISVDSLIALAVVCLVQVVRSVLDEELSTASSESDEEPNDQASAGDLS